MSGKKNVQAEMHFVPSFLGMAFDSVNWHKLLTCKQILLLRKPTIFTKAHRHNVRIQGAIHFRGLPDRSYDEDDNECVEDGQDGGSDCVHECS